MNDVATGDLYTDVVSALLETFFPAVGTETEDEKCPLVVKLLRTPGIDSPDITAEVRHPGSLAIYVVPLLHLIASAPDKYSSNTSQVLRTLRVLPPESQRDLFL